MSTTSAPVRPSAVSLRGVGAPGVGGYVVAFLASAAFFSLSLIASLVLADVGTESAWGVTDIIPTLFFLPLSTIALTLVYGWPAALLGSLVVHAVCLRVRSQLVHVLVAGLTGVAAGWCYDVLLFGRGFGWLWLQLGIATGIGRAVVIPLARRRTS